jgi:hypothetical protein
MKVLLLVLMLLSSSVAYAQSTDSMTPGNAPAQIQTQQPPPGSPQSDNPAATTGTAPVDSNTPSGTATTGTSGLTLEQAREPGTSQSLIWGIVLVAALAALIVYMRRRAPRNV